MKPPPLSDVLILALLVAPAAWLIVQLGKDIARSRPRSCPGDSFLWQWGLRFLAALVGALLGLPFLQGWWGALVGLSAGVLASTLVAIIKLNFRLWASPQPRKSGSREER